MTSLSEQFAHATHHKHKAFENDQLMQVKGVALGTLEPEQVTGLIALAMVKMKSLQKQENQKKERSARDLLQLALMHYIDDLNREIASLEQRFEARFGDAWLEEIALRVFDEDDIPGQLEGETIEAYRERLKALLVDEMLNDDGTIKDEYQGHPELGKYAEWAQKIHNRDTAIGIANELKNADINHAQTQEILERLEHARNSEQNIYTARELDGHEEEKEAVLDTDDTHRDDQGLKQQSDFNQSFLKPIGH